MTWKTGIAVGLTTLFLTSPAFAQAPGGGPGGSGPGGAGTGAGPGTGAPGGTSGGGSGPTGSPGGGSTTPGTPSTPGSDTPGVSKQDSKSPCPSGQSRSKTTQTCQPTKSKQPKS